MVGYTSSSYTVDIYFTSGIANPTEISNTPISLYIYPSYPSAAESVIGGSGITEAVVGRTQSIIF